MNVLYEEVGEDIAYQIFTNAKVDNSGITFEPVSHLDPQGKWKPDELSIDFVKPGWKICKTQIAKKFVLTQKISAFSLILGTLHPFAMPLKIPPLRNYENEFSKFLGAFIFKFVLFVQSKTSKTVQN